jgi:hypothetical protein
MIDFRVSGRIAGAPEIIPENDGTFTLVMMVRASYIREDGGMGEGLYRLIARGAVARGLERNMWPGRMIEAQGYPRGFELDRPAPDPQPEKKPRAHRKKKQPPPEDRKRFEPLDFIATKARIVRDNEPEEL